MVERDLDIILEFAKRIEASTSWGRRVGALALADGFAANLREELDYRIEARNTKTLAQLLQQRSRSRVPAVHEELCTRRVRPRMAGRPRSRRCRSAPRRSRRRSPLARARATRRLPRAGARARCLHRRPPSRQRARASRRNARPDRLWLGRTPPPTAATGTRPTSPRCRPRRPRTPRGALLDLAVRTEPVDLDALDRALTQFLAQRLGPGSRPGAELFSELLALLTSFGLAFSPELAGVFRALLTLEETLRTIDPNLVLIDEVKALASDVRQKTFGPTALRDAVSDDLLRLGPILRNLPKRIDRIATAMERNQWGANIRLLADERDARFITRHADRALLAFLSAAIGVISAILINAGDSPTHITAPHALGYTGLVVATILGLRTLVAITRDRVV